MIAIGSRALRRGFTIIECGVALAALAAIGVIAAQLATWSASERARLDARLEAIEAATNLLEQARARPWEELTPEWASSQQLPDYLATRWPRGRLTVRVEAEPERPGVKRVTVEVYWGGGGPERAVTLTALLAARTAGGAP